MLSILCLSLLAKDIVVYENEYKVLELDKQVKKLIVGNKEVMNISLLNEASAYQTQLKLFGKKSGNTSILIVYRDGEIENYHVYVNQNLGYVQKMINTLEPSIVLSKVGDGSTVISGNISDPHQKNKILKLLESAGVDMRSLMDLTKTTKVNKMIRTKLYLVEINNNKAKDLGGASGLGFFSKYVNTNINPDAVTGATFSGFLLDHTGSFVSQTGNSVIGTLRFLEEKGIAQILDDTVLITTEDKNASFHVGGEVYIPVGMRQTSGDFPMIELEEKEYGLRLTLNTQFMENENFMHIDVNIEDSAFDTNKEHYVKLGKDVEVPSFISKHIDTDIVAKSQQVIALGGRLHSEKIEYEDKIPLLGDIPGIGGLFRTTRDSYKENDLLFFLVPEIVDANKELDDSEFYREFKEEATIFHEKVMDMNSTAEEEFEKSIITEEINTSVEIPLMEIEVDEEESGSSLEGLEIIRDDSEDEKSLEGFNVTKSSNEESLKKKELEEKLYEVKAEKIFVRQAPISGKVLEVWTKGHPFRVLKEEEHDGSVWVQIKEDCLEVCHEVENYWIAKKYIQ